MRPRSIAVPLVAALVAPAGLAQAPTPPDIPGFEQLLPRGAIAALIDPKFVSAERAEIPDDAWILGYAEGDEAYAYDLNLLNAHEVVNHRAGQAAIAAVW